MDYRNVFGVNTDVCPESIQEIFLKRISAVLNKTDNDNLATPVFLYFSQDECVLYGFACLNRVLSSDYCTDKTNGSIRGFIGVLTSLSQIQKNGIVYSFDFYRSLYTIYVVPEWETYTSRCKEDVALDEESFSAAHCIFPKLSSVINNDCSICRLFPATYDGSDLLAEAIGMQGNMSIALNVDSEEQVSLPNYFPLMNALLKTAKVLPYDDMVVKHRCIRCKTDVGGLFKDNLCINCWNQLNRPKTPIEGGDYCKKCGNYSMVMMDGLCSQCRNVQPQECKCAQCGRETDALYTKYKLCDSCYAQHSKKKIIKRLLITISLFVIILLFLAWIFFIGSKEMQFQF